MTTRDHLRREVVGEMRGERCGEGFEVGAPVVAEAARRDHFPDVPPEEVTGPYVRGGVAPARRRIGTRRRWNRAPIAKSRGVYGNPVPHIALTSAPFLMSSINAGST